MIKLLRLTPLLLLLATPALSQQVTEAAKRDLWCALAFSIVAKDVPTDATAEQLAVVSRYVDGAKALRAKAEVAYLEAGFDDIGLGRLIEVMEPEITAQLSTTDKPADYSFEECSALLGIS